MRLFVVEIKERGAEGGYMTRDAFIGLLGRDALDEALLAVIDVAHVGMVISFRRGWVFCAEDASA
jgi:hypothetical protein